MNTNIGVAMNTLHSYLKVVDVFGAQNQIDNPAGVSPTFLDRVISQVTLQTPQIRKT